MTYYERNLPHWHPDGKLIFLTWRLYGSLPQRIVSAVRHEQALPGKRFARVEQFLDGCSFGPLWLKHPKIAAAVEASIVRGAAELNQYRLLAYAVMPNHVHLLVEPSVPVARITRGIKGTTAREANRMLKRQGLTFWQAESFDRWVRDEVECEKIRRYIEANPVKAGLVADPETWPWSSASKRVTAQAGVPELL